MLINQEDEYVLYDENAFAQSINVSKDIINCIEELGIKWRINHLNDNITSIDIPIKHNLDNAINIIKKEIEKDIKKSYILTRYVEKNNEKRETIYFLSKLLFGNKIGEKYIVENFKEEIWNDSDKFIMDQIILMAEKWENYSEIIINKNDYNKLLNFLYENNNKIFDDKKLLPSINGAFYFLKDLYMEYNINKEIKDCVEKYAKLNYNDKILDLDININKLNIKKYCIDDLLKEINNYFEKNYDNIEKVKISEILLKFLPNLEPNETNKKIIKELNDIRNIYNIINNQLLKEEPLETNENTIWSNVDKYIMIDIQKKIQNKKEINIDEEKKYIELLNKYQKYFNFKEYNLIPNSYGVLHNISNLKDFNDIPDEILLGIKRILFKDLKANSTYKGIIIDGIEKVSMVEIGNIIEECFKNKKKEEEEKFNYNTTYGLLKVIIRYVPIDEERKKKQVRFYNLYKLFDKDIGDMIEVNSHENLYSHINKGLIQYINEQI